MIGEARDFVPGVTAIVADEERGRIDAGVHTPRNARIRFDEPDALDRTATPLVEPDGLLRIAPRLAPVF